MNLKIIKIKFQCYNNKEVIVRYRDNTSDWNTINSIMQNDEYHTKEIGNFAGTVNIDIGSHIGAFPLLLSTIVPNAGVYCFEPIPENHDLLFNNLQDNDLQGFGYCWPLAVACRFRPKVRLYYGDDSENGKVHKYIGSPVYTKKNIPGRDFVDVEAINLTDIFALNDIQQVHVLKIDAETFEWEILADTPKAVLKRIRWIIGDLHPHPTEESWKTLDDLLKVTRGLFVPYQFNPRDRLNQNFFLRNKNL